MNNIYSTANLGGGAGAQLFQIAHACAQGWKHGIEPAFSTQFYVTYNAPSEFWPQHLLGNLYRNITFVDTITDYTILQEDNFNFNKFLNVDLNFEKTILFRGYFESSKNFMGYDEKLRDLFSPPLEFIQKAIALYPELNNSRTISMHIRRGDFFGCSDILPVVSLPYLEECINRVGDYDTLLVFSNDKDYAKTLQFKNMKVVVGLENYEEIWLMSMCKVHILSNSTYGWWGQFLSRNQNREVYAPSTWFGPNGPGLWDGGTPGAPYDSIYEKHWSVVDTKYENGYIVRN